MVDQAEIHRKVMGSEIRERREAVGQLRNSFAVLPDKEQAWDDLHQLTRDGDYGVRWLATRALGTAFPHIPDKEQAWKDLIRLTQDEDYDVRRNAKYALGTAFPHSPNTKQAWKDLHQLTWDEDSNVRRNATDALGTAFPYIPDTKQAWKDKEQAWKDMHRLTQDEDCNVRRDAADALGLAFSHIYDKGQAWKDLIRLTHDEDSDARASANHSLGRASIFKATEAESDENFRKELKEALKFFGKSSKEKSYFNPSRFCFPFYRSFYTVSFKKRGAGAEVQKYLAEAKRASKDSKSKEQLFEAVENLANALTEVHKAQEANLDTIKCNLNTCRQYCESAADLIGAAEEKTPGAARVLRRGLPIIDERIKEIILEIQERARAVCKRTRGTPLEELGRKTIKYAQELPIQNHLALKMALDKSSILEDWCEYLPADKKIYACEQLKNLPNMEQPEEQAVVVLGVLEYVIKNSPFPRIQTVHISATQQEIVRIAVVQFCFELTESFPFVVKNKDEVKTKIFSTLDIARDDGANIVCLPELCLCKEWINEIKEKYPDMIVIGGSFYKDGKNISSVIMESDVDIPCQPKITPSASEDSVIMESRMIPGDGVYRYETQFGRFVILMCRDFDNFVQYFRNMTDIDMISCPAFNPANDRFHKEADIHVEKIPSYILIANAGLYGGTSIFGRLNRNYFSTLVGGGCKDAGDLTYKLCEVKKGQEGMIIADFNLIYKSIQVPTPSDPNEEIRSVENIKKIPIQLKQ